MSRPASDAVTPDEVAPDAVVEARGVLCPVPIIRLARAAAALPAGALVELRTDDPAAEYDVPAWCRLRGHHLLHTEAVSVEDHLPLDGSGAPGPEPHVPNHTPGLAQRHLIRLAAGNAAATGPSTPGSTSDSTGGQDSVAGRARR